MEQPELPAQTDAEEMLSSGCAEQSHRRVLQGHRELWPQGCMAPHCWRFGLGCSGEERGEEKGPLRIAASGLPSGQEPEYPVFPGKTR